MGEVKHVSIDTPIEEILNILDEDAGLIIDNFLSDQNLESIKNDLKPYLNVTRNGQDEFTGFETKESRCSRWQDQKLAKIFMLV